MKGKDPLLFLGIIGHPRARKTKIGIDAESVGRGRVARVPIGGRSRVS